LKPIIEQEGQEIFLKQSRKLQVRSIPGTSLTDNDDVKRRWKEYTKNLYRRDKTMSTKFTETEYVQEPQVLESEVRSALHELADGKAPGGYDIPVELINAAGDDAVTAITRICRRIWENNQWLEDWRCSVFIPIPKKGDARECENNRTIALNSHTSKNYSKDNTEKDRKYSGARIRGCTVRILET